MTGLRATDFKLGHHPLFDYEMLLHEAEIEKKFATFDVGIQMAVAFIALADESRALSLLIRYESRLQRLHERALNARLPMRRSPKPAQPELTGGFWGVASNPK